MTVTTRAPLAEDIHTRLRASELQAQLDLFLTLVSLEFNDLLLLIVDALGQRGNLPPWLMKQEQTLSPLRDELLERALSGEIELAQPVDPRIQPLPRCYISYIYHRLQGNAWEKLLELITEHAYAFASKSRGDSSPSRILEHDQTRRRNITMKSSFGYARLRGFVAAAIELLTTGEAPVITGGETLDDAGRAVLASQIVTNFTRLNAPNP